MDAQSGNIKCDGRRLCLSAGQLAESILSQVEGLKQGPPVHLSVHPRTGQQASDHGRRRTIPSRSRRKSECINKNRYLNKEQLTLNQRATGSTPVRPTILG